MTKGDLVEPVEPAEPAESTKPVAPVDIVHGGRLPMGSLDIKALLTVALEQKPRDGADERILNRVATMTTMMEFARLLFVAPVDWLIGDHSGETEADADADEEVDEGHDDATD